MNKKSHPTWVNFTLRNDRHVWSSVMLFQKRSVDLSARPPRRPHHAGDASLVPSSPRSAHRSQSRNKRRLVDTEGTEGRTSISMWEGNDGTIRLHAVRDIATFFEQPLQYGGCISDFQNHCCNLISKKEVAAAILKIANTTSNLGLCCTRPKFFQPSSRIALVYQSFCSRMIADRL